MTLPDLSGKVVAITGASRGIGAGIANDYFARGMRLALCARSPVALPEGPRVLARRLDVVDEAAVDAFARDAMARFGRVDLWINNAGVLEPIVPVRELTPAALRAHLDVNLIGALNGCRAFLRHVLDAQGAGVLVNVSSGAAWKGYAGWAAYCAGKAALDRLTETLQLEEGARGLRAHAVAPGIVNTQMQELIRRQSAEVFPEVERFRRFLAEDSFNSVPYVARHVLALAFDPEHRSDEVVIRLAAEKQ